MFGFGPSNSDVKAAISAVAAGEAVLLDVRTPAEFDDVHAVGAINFELDRLMHGHMPPVGKTDQIYVYCRSGARSGQAQHVLQGAGFSQVTNLGPLSAWQSAGGPVEQSDGPSVAPSCEIQL